MQKLPLSLSALSVVVAIVLWYIATLLQGDRQPVEPVQGPDGVPAFGRQQQDSDLRGGAAALRCQDSERHMQALVEDSRYCETNEDCTIFDYGYPIQCLMSVAKSEITNLRLEFREYEENCEFRVYYDCPSEPMEREAVCRNNRCEVELQTLDRLRNETLDYLGIDEER